MLLKDMTEPELQELLTTLVKQIEAVCAVLGVEKPLFTLLLWNDPAVALYISNAQRADVIKALLEAAGRLSRREDVPRVPFPRRGSNG